MSKRSNFLRVLLPAACGLAILLTAGLAAGGAGTGPLSSLQRVSQAEALSAQAQLEKVEKAIALLGSSPKPDIEKAIPLLKQQCLLQQKLEDHEFFEEETAIDAVLTCARAGERIDPAPWRDARQKWWDAERGVRVWLGRLDVKLKVAAVDRTKLDRNYTDPALARELDSLEKQQGKLFERAFAGGVLDEKEFLPICARISRLRARIETKSLTDYATAALAMLGKEGKALDIGALEKGLLDQEAAQGLSDAWVSRMQVRASRLDQNRQ